LLNPQLAEILDQVVGEGIVVIDDEEHCPRLNREFGPGSIEWLSNISINPYVLMTGAARALETVCLGREPA